MTAVIDKALWKLRCTDLTVNLTDIFSKREKYANKLNVPFNDKHKSTIEWRGVLLPNEIVSTRINGKNSKSVIHFLGKSIILRIADLKDQVARADLNLLAVPIRTTENTLTLIGYLLERILKIRGNKLSNSI